MDEGDVDGILLLDKPSGPTSHDLVAAVKAILGGVKTGHAGTLDPMASGLLIVLAGKATRLAPYLPGDPKLYEGSILLGISTDSMDIEGRVVREAAFSGGPERVREALAALVGETVQLPPMFSAAKYRGKPLYRYARRGVEVPRKGRKVRIYRAEMRDFRVQGERAEVDFAVECSPGTYVRELAARVGGMLGCGGTLSRLRRLASGPFRVDDALELEAVRERAARGTAFLLPPERAVEGYKWLEVSEAAAQAVRNGVPLREDMLKTAAAGLAEGDTVAVMAGGALLGMHEVVRAEPLRTRALRMM